MMGAMEQETWLWEITVNTNMMGPSEPPQVEGGRLIKTETRGSAVIYTFEMIGPRPQ